MILEALVLTVIIFSDTSYVIQIIESKEEYKELSIPNSGYL
jgi:hypothetical protein